MLKLLKLAESALSMDEKCMLCSVVRLDGSGYGRVGARLLLTESGEREGYISGGCLEKDLLRRVWVEAAHTPRLMAFDTRGQALQASRYNTGCQGVVYVLCQPVLSQQSLFYKVASQVVQQRRSTRLMTIYHSEWDGLRTGDALALSSDGIVYGTMHESVQGPTNCAGALSGWIQLLEQATSPYTATLYDQRGAPLELTIEFLVPPKRLVIFGSGDDVQPVVRAAVGLGWETCVIGHRPEMTTALRFPGAQVHVGRPSAVPPDWIADAHTHVLLMTHDLASDVEALPRLLGSAVNTIGSLGSKSRLARVVAELYRRGTTLDGDQVARIRCPVGLDIGANSPEEIATSIVAELIAMEHGKSCASVSQHVASIHSPVPHYTWQHGAGQRNYIEAVAGSLTNNACTVPLTRTS